MPKTAKVYLVGAGPGDPELLTLKAKRLLGEADVVIYDYLAHETLLSYAPQAEKIYVGKTAGRHTLPQPEINALLVRKAQEGYVVVRLKGGDPFIFGRGGEEAEELVKAGIDFEIVPGITSAIAVPAYAGIPLTHRACASSVAFVTGHEDPTKHESSIDWEHLAKGVDTIVFLMGVGRLPFIAEQLKRYGRLPDTPVAVIRWGTLPEQEVLIGNLDNIADLARKKGLKPPAIIVVGNVVKLRQILNWWETKPLFGKRILITRAQAQASAMMKGLQALGARCYLIPTIKIVPAKDRRPVDTAIKNLSFYDWCLFTSVNGVIYFRKRLESLGYDVRALSHLKFGVIGEKTAQALLAWGIKPDLMPDEYRAESLAEALLKDDLKDKRIIIPRARLARDVLPETLQKAGAKVDVVTVYETVVPEDKKEELERIISEGIDVITFTSSSTVKHLAKLVSPKDLVDLLDKVKVACIGPITADTAREFGLRVDIMPSKYTIDALIEAIANHFVQS